jgi:hypothetical protein
VIGIAENERSTELLQIGWRERFYGCLGTDRRKYRGWNIAMGRVDHPCSGVTVFVLAE